jgi:hypothetical protein
MRPKSARIALVLIVAIVSGGVLLAFTNPPSSNFGPAYPTTQPLGQSQPRYGAAATVTTTAAAAGAYAPFPSFSFNGAGSPAATTTATMTTISTSSITVGRSTTVSPSQTPSASILNSGQAAGAIQASTATGNRSIEFSTVLTLQVLSPPMALEKASTMAYSLGGYVASSVQTNSTASLVVRVPAANYQSALGQLESLGTIVTAASSSNDVTVAYADLNATLLSLTTEANSLLKLLNQSNNINSTLNVENNIQRVDQQINEVQSQILQTRTLVSYGTISIEFVENLASSPLSLRLTATPLNGMSPLSVTLNAVVKGGTGPYVVNYNFGDGSSSQGQALIHTFVQPGRYNVTVTATDSSANVGQAWSIVNVSPSPVSSSLGGFPNFVGGLFLSVVEGIIEVVVVVAPIAGVVLLIVLPLRRRLTPAKGKAASADP